MACLDTNFSWNHQITSPSRNNLNRERSSFVHTQAIREVFVNVVQEYVQDDVHVGVKTHVRRKDSVKVLHEDLNSILDSIKLCAKQKNLRKGVSIHDHLIQSGLLEDRYVNSALISMYMSCGEIMKAQEVFDEIPVRHVISWNALILGYVRQGLDEKALDCYARMRDEGFSPNVITFTCILKACGHKVFISKGEAIHDEVRKKGLLKRNVRLGTALVNMYGKCGMLRKALEVFNEISDPDTITWTALISAYVQHGLSNEALAFYEQMQDESFSPDAVTFGCILKACGNIGSLERGEKIHAELRERGLLKNDVQLGTALVDMYAKCGLISKAQAVFDELLMRDSVSWTALIAGYVQKGLGEEALNCFSHMQDDGIAPDAFTFACILKACAITGSSDKGEHIHAEVNRLGLVKKDIVLGNAIVDMYVKCGMLEKAKEVLYSLPMRDPVSWTTVIQGYIQHDLGDEALTSFEQMREEGLNPDPFTFACILRACGSVGLSNKGEEIHAEISKQGLLRTDIIIGNALVDMYIKCGKIKKAQEVFDELPIHDTSSWSNLLAGYAQHGLVNRVFVTFSKMIANNIVPDGITFVVLLSACSHGGLLVEGKNSFTIMKVFYHLPAALEHYTCMVDLFSRAGCFENAISVIYRAEISDCLPMWLSLLSACQKWGNFDIGRWAFECSRELGEDDAAAYVSMSNIFADAGMSGDTG